MIRSSDDTAQARARLMSVFDLSQLQADYILELPLRRLTKFSRIELETERTQLRAEIEELTAILADGGRLRALVSEELAQVADEFGTPRRTVLPESAGTSVSAAKAAPLEVADDPCRVLLSSTGLVPVDLHGRAAAPLGGRRAGRPRPDREFGARDRQG